MESNHSVTKVIKRFQDFRYKLVFEGLCIGAVAGLVVVLFRLILGKLEILLEELVVYVQVHPWFMAVWFLILLCGAVITTLLLKWEPMISGSGIPQLDGEIQGYFQQTWWRVLTAKFLGGIITIGSGLSLGREGPSIQLGAMVGKGFARLTKRMKVEEKMLITCGASAGLSAAFNAPIAGALFALEEVHKNFSVEILLSSMASAITANFVSRNVFGLKPVFDFSGAIAIPLSHFWIVILLGAVVGLIGVLYNFCTDRVQKLYDKTPSQFIRTLIPFMLAGLFLYFCPAVLGGGSSLVMDIADKIPLITLAALLVIKFAFSITSFGAGIPGGIFLPLLVLGALCGGVFHGIADALGSDLNLGALLILGMAGSFAAIVRAPITGILLITEMTGNFTHLMFIALVSLTAFTVADVCHAKPIYDQLLRRMLFKAGRVKREETGEKLLLETPIHLGSPICGKRIREVSIPDRCLIIAVKRGEIEIVPRGETKLEAGDGLIVLCDEAYSPEVTQMMEEQCKAVVAPDEF